MKSSSLSQSHSVRAKSTTPLCSNHGCHEFSCDVLPTDIAEESGVAESEDPMQFQVRRFIEDELENRDLGGRFKGRSFGQQAISVAQLQECSSDLPESECLCEICNPRQAFEVAEEEEVFQKLLSAGRKGEKGFDLFLKCVVEELGENVRNRLQIYGIAC